MIERIYFYQKRINPLYSYFIMLRISAFFKTQITVDGGGENNNKNGGNLSGLDFTCTYHEKSFVSF